MSESWFRKSETATLELETAAAPDRADPDSYLSWLQVQAGTAAVRDRNRVDF